MTTLISDTLRITYLKAIAASQAEDEKGIERNRAFYSGDQGIELTDRQREYLGDIANDLKDQALANIAAKCVDIPLERLAILKIKAKEGSPSALADRANEWWGKLRLTTMQRDLYRYAMRDRASCLLVGWDAAKHSPLVSVRELFAGNFGEVKLHYDGDTGELSYASMRWRQFDPASQTETGKTRMIIWFSDRIERYEEAGSTWRLLASSEIDDGLANPEPWVDATGNPLGVAVIPFDNPGESELDDILMPQKALNKSLADLLSATDMHGFPILAVSKTEIKIDPATGKEMAIEIGPGKLLLTGDGDAHRIEGANLDQLWKNGVLSWIEIAALIKGWPVYLFNRSLAGAVSGEALKQMEAGLISQVEEKQRVFGDDFRDVFTLCAKLNELYEHETLDGELEFEWQPAANRDELAEMTRLEKKFTIGEIPIEQRWKELGYDEATIQEMSDMRNSEVAGMTAASMLAALRQQQQGVGLQAAQAQIGAGNVADGMMSEVIG